MKLEFFKAKYGIDFQIPETFLPKLHELFDQAPNKNLAVFSAVQFRQHLEDVQELLKEEGFSSQTSKPFRTAMEGQILGCDSYPDSLKFDLSEIDGFIYIGDGYFHPNALLLAQEGQEEIKPVILMNVVQQITEVIDESHIEKYLRKRKANFAAFYNSTEIGVFVTTKWGQEYMDAALQLKEKYPDKNFYYFIGDNFEESELENFPFPECWVNTACPRIGQDDILRHSRPLINIKDIW
jgi:diphthamide biosynthesis enzyme Dph1/Dph2-like protein